MCIKTPPTEDDRGVGPDKIDHGEPLLSSVSCEDGRGNIQLSDYIHAWTLQLIIGWL